MQYKLKKINEVDLQVIEFMMVNARNATLRNRAKIVYTLATKKGIGRREVAREAGVSDDTVTDTVKGYNEQGLAYLQKVNRYIKKSELDKHTDKIKAEFKKRKPRTANEAKEIIKIVTNLDKHINTIKKWLKNNGIELYKY